MLGASPRGGCGGFGRGGDGGLGIGGPINEKNGGDHGEDDEHDGAGGDQDEWLRRAWGGMFRHARATARQGRHGANGFAGANMLGLF